MRSVVRAGGLGSVVGTALLRVDAARETAPQSLLMPPTPRVPGEPILIGEVRLAVAPALCVARTGRAGRLPFSMA